MTINSFSISDIGNVRTENQDTVYASDKPVGALPNLYIVADGMGGHNAGGLAARLAVDAVIQMLEQNRERAEYSVEQQLRIAVKYANQSVFSESLTQLQFTGMGTTLVLCTILDDQTVLVGNIGDSRLYKVNKNIEQITVDHSFVEEMVRMGGLNREQARKHKNKNIITRAVGIENEITMDFFTTNMEKEDAILLCSDGLTNMVDDKTIQKTIMKTKDIEQAALKLLELAKRNGGRDNISIVLVKTIGSNRI